MLRDDAYRLIQKVLVCSLVQMCPYEPPKRDQEELVRLGRAMGKFPLRLAYDLSSDRLRTFGSDPIRPSLVAFLCSEKGDS